MIITPTLRLNFLVYNNAKIVLCFILRIRRRLLFNPLTPNGQCSGRTAPLTSRRCILNIYSPNIHTEYFEHAA
jgi:hypothetical protein